MLLSLFTTSDRKHRDPHKVKLAYTPDSIWRNRDHFLQGRDEIAEFLTDKWSKEKHYRLRKELFAFTDNKVCISFPISCFSLQPLKIERLNLLMIFIDRCSVLV